MVFGNGGCLLPCLACRSKSHTVFSRDSPIFMTVFFTYLGLVNGDGFAAIGDKIKNDLFTAVQGSWKVWPLVHTINFAFISTKHRLVFINGVQIAFNMFLSIIGSKSA